MISFFLFFLFVWENFRSLRKVFGFRLQVFLLLRLVLLRLHIRAGIRSSSLLRSSAGTIEKGCSSLPEESSHVLRIQERCGGSQGMSSTSSDLRDSAAGHPCQELRPKNSACASVAAVQPAHHT